MILSVRLHGTFCAGDKLPFIRSCKWLNLRQTPSPPGHPPRPSPSLTTEMMTFTSQEANVYRTATEQDATELPWLRVPWASAKVDRKVNHLEQHLVNVWRMSGDRANTENSDSACPATVGCQLSGKSRTESHLPPIVATQGISGTRGPGVDRLLSSDLFYVSLVYFGAKVP